MKTCVQIVQHLRPGGIECLALEMLVQPPTAERGLLISLEGTREDAIAAWPRLAGFGDRLVFMNKQPGRDPMLVRRLARVLRAERAHVVHTHHVGPMLYGGLAARLAGIRRLVHTEHDAWHLLNPARARLVRNTWRIIRPRIVADADLVAAQIRRAARVPVTAVIRNGVDLERFRPGNKAAARAALGLPAAVPVIGVVGRLNAVKNQRAAISALSHPTDRTIRLAIAGDGEERKALKQHAIDLGVSERVHFLGHLEGVETFYNAVDCLCLPSHSEGYPLSLIEAQACGLPVVATRVGGVPEAVCPGSGRLVEPGDMDALVTALTDTLREPQPALAREFAEHRGSLSRMLAAYRTVMA